MTVRKRAGLAVCILLVPAATLLLAGMPPRTSALTPHAPILIVGNADFTAANGVTGGIGTPADPYLIAGWEIDASAAWGIEIRDTDAHFVVRDVYVHNGTSMGTGSVHFVRVRNGGIENATISNSVTGVLLDSSANLSVSGDISTLGNGHGVVLRASTNVSVSGDIRYGAGGVYLDESTNVSISGRIYENTVHGLFVLSSGNISISSSDIVWNAENGVMLLVAENVTISDSDVSDNGSTGINVLYSANVSILGNHIARNRWAGGVALSNAANVTVHHNNFEYNAIFAGGQAIDRDGLGNAWDDGYPGGGNYWSDYTGVDLFGGPDQDVPGSDGIGDVPYDFSADSRDRYPLVAPTDASWPLPPTISAATLGGPALADLTLAWTPSPTEGRADGTVAYRVLRAIGDASGPYVEIGSTPATGQTSYAYACGGCGHVPGDATPHFYKVRAVDSSGRAADSNLAARYAKALAAGMHLLSVPLRQADDSLSTVLQTVWSSIGSVRRYDAADAGDPWKAYVPAKGRGELTRLPSHTAFWVDVTAAGQYTVAGLVVDRPSVRLLPGWNLVAYASPASETAAASLAGLPVARVETFAAIPDPYKLRAVAANEPLVWGEGYWVWVTAEGVWTQG